MEHSTDALTLYHSRKLTGQTRFKINSETLQADNTQPTAKDLLAKLLPWEASARRKRHLFLLAALNRCSSSSRNGHLRWALCMIRQLPIQTSLRTQVPARAPLRSLPSTLSHRRGLRAIAASSSKILIPLS